jgi:hypothetical protein
MWRPFVRHRALRLRNRSIRAERVYVDPRLDLAVVAYDPKALAKQPALPSWIARRAPVAIG